MAHISKIKLINGPVLVISPSLGFQMREMVVVGEKKLIGEIVKIQNDEATIQVYEETEGLKAGEIVEGTGMPLSVKLGPGMIGNMFDGIQRPLVKINENSDGFIDEGIGLISLDTEKKWQCEVLLDLGDRIEEGQIYATCQESSLIEHRCICPVEYSGEIIEAQKSGKYTIDETILKIKTDDDIIKKLSLSNTWPIRKARHIKERLKIKKPLITGQRVLDMFFPIAKGGTAAIPGGFGTGKTMTQHQLAKWCDADIIIYIGCGERGNEMTEVLEDFPKLIDPKSEKPLMDRTILIANTSNMPVAAREASIYTGITMAEYYRDMGYDVAIMADSTSRWAEALREISGRLEEIPAEEGFPAYLPSRLAEFYERAGNALTLAGDEASITIIGAVSPQGGDFSEPVTENTKRFVNAFLALDKKLAYSRHYPAINWLNSYSQYIKILKPWYESNVNPNAIELRNEILSVLNEEDRLSDIVKLVGEDVLPDKERLILEVSKLIKLGFLQQNAFNDIDTFVPLEKQYMMLSVIKYFYEKAKQALKNKVPLSEIKNPEIFDRIVRMKYTVKNENLKPINEIINEIESYFDKLIKEYSEV